MRRSERCQVNCGPNEEPLSVGLNLLNGKGEMLSDFPEEFDGGFGVVVIVDAQNPKSCGFIDGRELIKALTRSSDTGNELHIELDRAARNLQGRVFWFGARAIFFHRDAAHMMSMKDLQDGGR